MAPPRSKRLRPWRFVGIPLLLGIWAVISAAFVDQSGGAQSPLPGPLDVVTRDLPGFAAFGEGVLGEASSYPDALLVLLSNALSTMKLVATGTALGLVAGFTIGLLISRWTVIRRIIEPLVTFVRTVPLLALIPLFLVWFGGSYTGNVLYVAFAISVMIVINTIEAVRNVHPIHMEFARTMGASENVIYMTVVLPSILPELMGGIRVAVGLSWAFVLGAEYLASQSGLGHLLILSQNFLYTGRMIIIAAIFGLFAIALNALMMLLTKRVTKWTD